MHHTKVDSCEDYSHNGETSEHVWDDWDDSMIGRAGDFGTVVELTSTAGPVHFCW